MVWVVVLLCLGVIVSEGKPWEGYTGQEKPWEAKQPRDTINGGNGKYEISKNVENGAKVKVNIEISNGKEGQGKPYPWTEGPIIEPYPWTEGPIIEPYPWTEGPIIEPYPGTEGPIIEPYPWTEGPIIEPYPNPYPNPYPRPYPRPYPWMGDPYYYGTDGTDYGTDGTNYGTDDYNSATNYVTKEPYDTTNQPGGNGEAALKGVDAKHKVFKVMGKTYVKIEQKLNWYQAREKCQQLGKDHQLGFSNGDLASMPTYEEFDNVTKAEGMHMEYTGDCYPAVWIGLKTNGTDETTTWNWVSGAGEPVTSTNEMWEKNREPNMSHSAAESDRKCVYVVDAQFRRSIRGGYKSVINNFFCERPLCYFLCQLF